MCIHHVATCYETMRISLSEYSCSPPLHELVNLSVRHPAATCLGATMLYTMPPPARSEWLSECVRHNAATGLGQPVCIHHAATYPA